MNGFKVPNRLFKIGLKHAPMIVYLYLLSKQFNNRATSTYGQLADKLEMSAKTAYNAVHTLADKGLISLDYVRRGGRIAALKFTLQETPKCSWVWVEKRIFDYHLTASELLTYLYIKSRANNSGRAYPSIAVMHTDTGLSEQTIRKAIKNLTALSLLRRKHYIKADGGFGNNNYVVIGCAEHEEIMKTLRKKKVRTHKPGRGNKIISAIPSSSRIMAAKSRQDRSKKRNVFGSSFASGGLKITYLLKTHRSTIQYKKKKLKFSS